MDISLDYIRTNMFNNGTAPGTKEYLLNRNGEIILSSDFDDKKAETNSGSATMQVGQFPFLKEFYRAVKRRKVYFEASKYGRKYMFALNNIPSIGFYYIQQVSRKELLKDWKAKSSYYY
jgi:ABC-type Fe3+-hydroxamate transport system substrate-binding protein